MSFTDGLPPKTISAAISFWQEHEKNDNEWVPRFQQLPLPRQMDYLRVFFGYDNPRNFFEKATINTARRISGLAKRDLELARTVFWRTSEISPLDFDQAVFYALGKHPLLQARLLVARGAVQGARLLDETFEERTYDDLEAVRILIEGEGLSPAEKEIIREINRLFFQTRGGVARSFILRRLLVWRDKLSDAISFSRLVDRKIRQLGDEKLRSIVSLAEKSEALWRQLCEGLGCYSTPELYELLLLFYRNDRILILKKMGENGFAERVEALDFYLINEMGNKQ